MSPRQPGPRHVSLLPQRVAAAARQAGAAELAVAAALGLSQRQVQRQWRAHGYDSLETFLLDLRLQNAVRLLTILGSVKEAALLAGYPSAAPFCREFARSQGISPGRFFRRYRDTQPFWSDPEMRSVRRTLQAETRAFCVGLTRPTTAGGSLDATYGTTGSADYYFSGGLASTDSWTGYAVGQTKTVVIPSGDESVAISVVTRADNLTEQNVVTLELVPGSSYAIDPANQRAQVLIFDGPEFTLYELADSRPTFSGGYQQPATVEITGINSKSSPWISGFETYAAGQYSAATVGGYWPFSAPYSIIDLWGTKLGGVSPKPMGIANSDVMVGLSGTRAFRRSGSTTTLLPPTTGTSGAYGINPAGTDSIHYIVGFSPAAGESRAAVWVNGGNPRDLVQNLPGGGPGIARAVNDAGEVVGTAQLIPGQISQPFRSDPGAEFLGAGDELPVPAGAIDSSGSANAVGAGGGANGWFKQNNGFNPKEAAYWDPRSGNSPNGSGKNLSRWVPLLPGPADKLSEALGLAQVNGTDWSVGWSGDDETLSASNSKLKAVFMKGVGNPPVWRDLNDRHFTHGMTGWSLKKATAVNAQGWIVGNGFLNGTARGFLLVPRTAGQ